MPRGIPNNQNGQTVLIPAGISFTDALWTVREQLRIVGDMKTRLESILSKMEKMEVDSDALVDLGQPHKIYTDLQIKIKL